MISIKLFGTGIIFLFFVKLCGSVPWLVCLCTATFLLPLRGETSWQSNRNSNWRSYLMFFLLCKLKKGFWWGWKDVYKKAHRENMLRIQNMITDYLSFYTNHFNRANTRISINYSSCLGIWDWTRLKAIFSWFL